MHIIGKINIEIYKCITEDICTDEVIITDERIEHINERHPGDYDKIEPYINAALCAPDYILEDRNRGSTGLILKEICEDNIKFQLILKLHTSSDDVGYKNSVISAWKISESRWKNYIKNKKILYKSE